MPALTFPPFPDNVPTHPLLVIDYRLLKVRDEQEIDRLWDAATKIGFCLKNHGTDQEANKMFDLGEEVMALPLEEKLKFEQGDEGFSAGYKPAGANVVDANGEKDTIEKLNVTKDDALAWPAHVHRTYPEPVERQMISIVRPFVEKSMEVNRTLIDMFNDKLGLPQGTLLNLHPLDECSGCEARILKNPPMPHDNQKKALGAHTDFGSLSFLHNRLGGLQVLPPGAETWQFVKASILITLAVLMMPTTYPKPLPNHAICNIGDALSIFSGGILRSNLHRVIPPPGAQSVHERWSIVFFSRPGDSKVLRALVESSSLIAAAVASKPERNFETGTTAKEWFARRVKYRRIANRKGPETYLLSSGTEPDIEIEKR